MPAAQPEPDKSGRTGKRAALRLGRWRVALPGSRAGRIALGLGLLAGGSLFFLPLLGLWMIPAGLAVLSADSPWARRLRRRAELWWGGRAARRANKKRPGGEPGPKALGNGGVSSREDSSSVPP